MRLCALLVVSLVAFSLVPSAEAWPPVCIEERVETGVVNVVVMVTCGIDAYVETCIPGRGCTRHHLFS